ncbi:MAG: DUF790 family protein [Deltaproteobacteria bacterium]|nr:DUF790 family protein [Deltaproteobacteria bacterium]
MLTSDLLRARLVKGEVRPQYIAVDDRAVRERAESLLALFSAHVGLKRGALDDALTELVGEETDYLIHRGLAKLLEDRSTFETASKVDPRALRKRVFELASKSHPVSRIAGDLVHPTTRDMILEQAGQSFDMSLEEVDRALYSDLHREQRLESFETLSVDSLLHRYNLGLAQAVLLRAVSMRIRIAPGDPLRYRQLFRYVKFYRLLFSATGNSRDGYELLLDGPASLFTAGAKYGLQLASFLPALLLCDGWSIEAEILWGKDRRHVTFSLAAGAGLRSHYGDRGVYVTDEEAHFVKRFAAVAKGWKIEKRPEIIDLDGRGVLVPDLVLVHDDGREALLEIVGFWRRSYLEARWTLLESHGPPNLIVALSERLRVSEDDMGSLRDAVVPFKDVLSVKEVLARAEIRAVRPKTLRTDANASPVKQRAKKPRRKATTEES